MVMDRSRIVSVDVVLQSWRSTIVGTARATAVRAAPAAHARPTHTSGAGP
jgi:hypothetical protein